MARIESGKMEVSMEEVSLDDIIQQSITLISTQAQERNISVIDNVSSKGYNIHADFTRYKQVLVNLLTNAVKYNSDNGELRMDGEIVSESRLRVYIRDTGDGMSEKEVSRLFMPFERLDTVNNVEGTGIGLVITKHLVELMGGSIGVESAPGEGSVFWVEMNLWNSV